VTAAAALVGLRIVQQSSGRSTEQAPANTATAGRSTVPEKWRELQEPLPQVVQAGKDEEAIPFRARSAADPFAADGLIVLGQPAEKGGADREVAIPEVGLHSISRAAGGLSPASAQNASNAGGALPEDGATPAPHASIPSASLSPPEAGASESVGAAEAADRPSSAPEPPEETAGVRDLAGRVPSEGDGADAAGGDAQAAGPAQPRETGVMEAGNGAMELAKSETARSDQVSEAPSEPPESTSSTSGDAREDKRDAGMPAVAVTVVQERAAGVPAPAGAPAAGQGGGNARRPQEGAAVQTESPRVEPPPVLVTGIITSGDSATYAIVRTAKGSIIVRPGDEVEGVKVKAISEKSITVVKEGEEFVLELGGGSGR